MNTNKFGKCVECKNFIASNKNPKFCACEVKPGYVTMNALIEAYCDDYNLKEVIK